MTNAKGNTMRQEKTGEPYSLKLQPGDDPEALARVMTRKIHEAITGKGMAHFNRTIRYPNVGVA